jgi:hypothetical protein
MERTLLFFKESIDLSSRQEGFIAVKCDAAEYRSLSCDIAVELLKKPVDLLEFYNINWITFNRSFEEHRKEHYLNCLEKFLIKLNKETGQELFLVNNKEKPKPYFCIIDSGRMYNAGYVITEVERLRGSMHTLANMFFDYRDELLKNGYAPVQDQDNNI